MTRPGDRPPGSRQIPQTGDEKPPAAAVGGVIGLGALLGALMFWRSRKQEGSSPEGGYPRGSHSNMRRMLPEDESLEEGHELLDMRVGQVVRWLALLTAAVVVLVVAVTIFERATIGHIGTLQPVVEDVPKVTPPPQPRLELENGEILSQLHAKENQVLNNYTWIDQNAGKVSLPIDRAIELTAQRGLPVRQQQAGGQSPGGLTLPQSSSSGRTSETIP